MADRDPRRPFHWEQCQGYSPSVHHLLCDRCKNVIRVKAEVDNGFCIECAKLLVPVAPYVTETVWFRGVGDLVYRYPIGWIKLCCVCTQPIKISAPKVLSAYVCDMCQDVKREQLRLVFHNPNRKLRFVTYPAV